MAGCVSTCVNPVMANAASGSPYKASCMHAFWGPVGQVGVQQKVHRGTRNRCLAFGQFDRRRPWRAARRGSTCMLETAGIHGGPLPRVPRAGDPWVCSKVQEARKCTRLSAALLPELCTAGPIGGEGRGTAVGSAAALQYEAPAWQPPGRCAATCGSCGCRAPSSAWSSWPALP